MEAAKPNFPVNKEAGDTGAHCALMSSGRCGAEAAAHRLLPCSPHPQAGVCCGRLAAHGAWTVIRDVEGEGGRTVQMEARPLRVQVLSFILRAQEMRR